MCETEWNDPDTVPTVAGWYEVEAVDDRFADHTGPVYRGWGNGRWWTPLPDGWFEQPNGLYRWRGPVADINGPAPDGTNPRGPQ